MTVAVERLRELLVYDPETGVFRWRVSFGRWGRTLADTIAGCVNKSTGYHFIKIDGRPYSTHRLAWLYMTGAWPVDQIDHVNMDKVDNRWCNLRAASRFQAKAVQ